MKLFIRHCFSKFKPLSFSCICPELYLPVVMAQSPSLSTFTPPSQVVKVTSSSEHNLARYPFIFLKPGLGILIGKFYASIAKRM